MTKILNYLISNTAFGILLGAVLAFSIAQIVDQNFSTWIADNITAFASPLISTIAAILALAGVMYNVDQQNERHRADRRARLVSARATFLNALEDLLAVANCHLDHEFSGLGGKDSAHWDIAPDTMNSLKECVEFSEGEIRNVLIEIIIIHRLLIEKKSPNGQPSQSQMSNWSCMVRKQSNRNGKNFSASKCN